MLQRFVDWIYIPVGAKRLLAICAGILVVTIAYEEIAERLTGVEFKLIPDLGELLEMCETGDNDCRDFATWIVETLTWFFWESPFHILAPGLVVLAFVEEVPFRWLPLAISVRWIGVRNALIFVILPVSFVFGWWHYSFGWNANALLGGTLLQGVAGIVLSIVYLKAGGAHKRHSRALLYATGFHAVYNIVAIYLMRYNGAL